jgi:UDP-glucose 4-epimerase
MVLPRLVEAALAGQPLIVHDDGQQVRCFAHVADVVNAVLSLMQSPAALGQVFNIGSDVPVSILDLARRVIARSGSTSTIEFQTYTAAYDKDFEDIRRRVPDLTRLRNTIAHQPAFDLDSIIRDVIQSRRS